MITEQCLAEHRQRVADVRRELGVTSPEDIDRLMDEFVDRVFPDKEALAQAAREWWCDEIGVCE